MMQEKLKNFTLKLIALSGFFSFVYPGAMLLRYVLFNQSGGLISVLMASVLVLGGFLAALLMERMESCIFIRLAANPAVDFVFGKNADASFLSTFTAYCTCAIPVTLILAMFRDEGKFRICFETWAAFIFYFIGLRAYYGNYDRILSGNRLKFGTAILAASMLYGFMSRTNFNFYAYACISMITSMIIANQANIDNVFFKMNRQLAGVSKNLRSFNVLCVIALFALTVLLVNLKGIVMLFFDISGMIFKVCISLFLKLLSLITIVSKVESGVERGQPLQPFALDDESSLNPYIEFILRMFAYLIVLYAVYKAVPIIIRNLKKLWHRFFKYLKRMFVSPSEENTAIDDYSDEVENILPGRARREDRFFKNSYKQRSFRNLKKISDPVEKIRYLYGLMLDCLIERNVCIFKSDTARDICRKGLTLQNEGVYMNEITDIYEKVRYGDRIPPNEEVALTEEYCRKTIEKLKTRNIGIS